MVSFWENAGSALIGGASSLIGNIFGAKSNSDANKTNLQINKMNNQFNEQMLQKQLDYQTDMWNKTNEYNDPKNARARLEAAGYNPSAFFSNGQAGSASAMSGGSASAGSSGNQQGFTPNLQGIGDAISQGMQFRQQQLNNELHRAQLEVDLDMKRQEQRIHGFKVAEQLEELRQKVKGQKLDNYAKATSNRFLADMLSADLKTKNRQFEIQKLEMESRVISNAYNDARLQNYGKEFAAQMAEQYARIAVLKQQNRLTDRQVESEIQKALTEAAKRNGINLENRKKYRTLEAEVWQVYADVVNSGISGITNMMDAFVPWKKVPKPSRLKGTTKQKDGDSTYTEYYYE